MPRLTPTFPPRPDVDGAKLKTTAERLTDLLNDFSSEHAYLREHAEALATRLDVMLAEVKAMTEPAVCGSPRLAQLHCYLLDGHEGPHIALTAPADAPAQEFWHDRDPRPGDRVRVSYEGIFVRMAESGGDYPMVLAGDSKFDRWHNLVPKDGTVEVVVSAGPEAAL